MSIIVSFQSPTGFRSLAVFADTVSLYDCMLKYPKAEIQRWESTGVFTDTEIFHLKQALTRASRGVYGPQLISELFGNEAWRTRAK